MLIVQSILLALELVVWLVWMATKFTAGLTWVVDVVLHIVGLGQ